MEVRSPQPWPWASAVMERMEERRQHNVPGTPGKAHPASQRAETGGLRPRGWDAVQRRCWRAVQWRTDGAVECVLSVAALFTCVWSVCLVWLAATPCTHGTETADRNGTGHQYRSVTVGQTPVCDGRGKPALSLCPDDAPAR